MPTFKLNRNFTLRSTLGHIINFEADKETHVPPALVKEALSIGAEEVGGKTKVLDDETPENVIPSGDERNELIFKAMAALIEKNEREDFTGSGAPQVTAIEKIVGFDIDAKERDKLWVEYREKVANG